MAAETAPGTPAIRLRRLRKEFAGTPPVVAVHDVDLDVRAGEFFSMLGPSGSGKRSPRPGTSSSPARTSPGASPTTATSTPSSRTMPSSRT
jgi:ABC-type phosphonate transport system ATPase subunit